MLTDNVARFLPKGSAMNEENRVPIGWNMYMTLALTMKKKHQKKILV